MIYIFLKRFLAASCVLRDLSSLTRDRTWAPAVEAWSPNHWTAREVPQSARILNMEVTALTDVLALGCERKRIQGMILTFLA